MGGGYYRNIRTKKLRALLIRQGFVSVGGAKHGKYARNDNQDVIIVPRHTPISPGTSKQLCEQLEHNFHVPKSELNKLF